MIKCSNTKLTFSSDLVLFWMERLGENTICLLSKYACGITWSMASRGGKKLGVYLNKKKLSIKDFRSYPSLFSGVTPPAAYERLNER